ncbi:MAG: hypothetical protein GX625_06710, partial [Clostridiaceae bacterium]|nr:hypothetical protein [Clostridiaceae bacterium]
MFSFKKLLIGLLVIIILLSALQGCSGRFEQHDREDSKREEVSEDRNSKDKKEDIDEDKNEDVDEKGEEEDEKDEEDDIRSERDEDKENDKKDKDKKDKDKKAVIDEKYEWLIGSWQCSAFSGNVGFVSIYAYFGHIRTLIPGTSGRCFGIIRTAFRLIRTPC